MENSQPAGGYPDPKGSDEVRHWDGSAWPEHDAEPQAHKPTKHWIASRSRILGILIAVWPIILVILGALRSRTNMWDESSGGSALYLVFLIFSVPFGLAVIAVGSFIGARAESKNRFRPPQ